jgi:TolB protein
MAHSQQAEEEGGGRPTAVGLPLGTRLDVEEAQSLVFRRLKQLVGGVLLSETGIQRLVHRLRPRRYLAGELIIPQGVRGDFFGLVTEGQVALFSSLEADTLRATDPGTPDLLLLPGSTFGEAMLIDGRPSGSTLRAVTDVELYILRRADYQAVLGQRSSQRPREAAPRWRWPVVAALALFLAAVLVGALLAWGLLSGWLPVGDGTVEADGSPELSDVIQIVEPLDGEVVQHSALLPVRAVFSEPGFYQAKLQVGLRDLPVQLNPDLEAVPWVAEWAWEEVGEGSFRLAVEAQTTKGEWKVSAPVTMTVVPSGTLAFTSNRDGAPAIDTLRTDGRDVQRLTAGPGDARQPAWRSGNTLAFVVEPTASQTMIQQMTASSGEAEALLAGHDPAWSPDGTRLAYASSVDDVSQVFIAAIAGGTPYTVTAEAAYAGQPTWSPDGTRLAYVAQREGNWDIWVVALDGSEPKRVTDDPARDWAPAWSPDGKELAFVSNRGGSYQIYLMRADGAAVRSLTDFPLGAESPAWSPDGHWLAFVAYTGGGTGVSAREIHLMRVDGQAQVRLTHNESDDSDPDWHRAP